MNETDLMWMSALIFAPTLFALVLLFIPKSQVELMRWVALLGSGVALAISLIVLIGYLEVPGVIAPGEHAGLEKRVTDASASQAITIDPQTGQTRGGAPANPNDWVGRVPWIKAFNIEYYLGVDGISLPLIVLTTALCFLAVIASWKIEKHVRGYLMLFLLLETGMVGCFVALDFFLFYIFWEVMLLPMYFLIGVWGGPRREYAAIKFFLYTLLGSVFILIALLGFYFTDIRDFVNQDSIRYEKALQNARKAAGGDDARARAALPQFLAGVQPAEVHSFDLIALAQAGRKAFEIIEARAHVKTAEQGGDPAAIKAAQEAAIKVEAGVTTKNQPFFTSSTFQITMFVLLFVGFAIKVPVFPFHTWLPDAHVEAPTPISMILAGVLLKLGGYGILRIAYPICPWAAEFLAWPICVFGVINIVYGAFAAMAQTDFKKLVAYSSVSHMGYVILGIAVWKVSSGSQYWWWGINGAMFQMIAHGITSAGMFFLVGVIYDRAHHRNLDNFRGLMEPMPLFGGISAIIFFAAMGLPGLCGFVGEVFVILATWNFSKVLAIIAALTVVLTAAYILWTVQRVYFGTNPAHKDYTDMDLREVTIATPLVVFSVLLGIFPSYFLLSWMSPSIDGFVDALKTLGAR